MPSYLALLVDEVLHPFYMFQVASITLWMCDDYYYYAACIIIISLISISVSLYETRRQAESLHTKVSFMLPLLKARSSLHMGKVSCTLKESMDSYISFL